MCGGCSTRSTRPVRYLFHSFLSFPFAYSGLQREWQMERVARVARTTSIPRPPPSVLGPPMIQSVPIVPVALPYLFHSFLYSCSTSGPSGRAGRTVPAVPTKGAASGASGADDFDFPPRAAAMHTCTYVYIRYTCMYVYLWGKQTSADI